MAELTYAQVSQILKYDPETGKLFWLPRAHHLFVDGSGSRSAAANAARWNGRYAHKEAFTAITRNGYAVGRIFDTAHTAHRIAWLMSYKQWPEHGIDHIDGDKLNNRIINLRDVPHSENAKNTKLLPANISGVHGVTWSNKSSKWQVHISIDKRRVFLGYYTDITEAKSVRFDAEVANGYHKNHGRRQVLSVKALG